MLDVKLPEPVHTGVYDAAVVGGGLVGASIAYGLRRTLDHITVIDEGDVAYRASRGNFGLVWVQSKGMGKPQYSAWTRASASHWAQFAQALMERTGVNVHHEQLGGLHILLSEEEKEARIRFMTELMDQPGMLPYDWKLLDRQELADMVPGIGPDVCGASWTSIDGTANPLKLLRALHTSFSADRIDYRPMHGVVKIDHIDGLFHIHTTRGAVRATKVVLAAGLGNKTLGEQLGLHVPVRPQRGQIIALERTRPLLRTPMATLRQMDEGTWLIGDSQEEAGFADQQTGLPILATLADRAVRTLPALRDVRVVRSWAALRVMSPDGYPIYQESRSCPGAFVVTCHSGVTLAAAHALLLAPMIAGGSLPVEMAPFSAERFHVPEIG